MKNGIKKIKRTDVVRYGCSILVATQAFAIIAGPVLVVAPIAIGAGCLMNGGIKKLDKKLGLA